MTNELEQRAYESNTGTSETSTRQGMSRGKITGYIAAGIGTATVLTGIALYNLTKNLPRGPIPNIHEETIVDMFQEE